MDERTEKIVLAKLAAVRASGQGGGRLDLALVFDSVLGPPWWFELARDADHRKTSK